MAHWKSMMDRDYIYAFDLAGKDATLTIERVVASILTGEGNKKSKKPVAFFAETKVDETGKKKGLALCATNCKVIAGLYGNDTDNWIGKKITLYPTETEAFGKTVECIRIRNRAPAQNASPRGGPRAPQPNGKPEREPGDEPYDGPPDDYVSKE